MMQRPAWWLGLLVLTGLAVAALASRKMPPRPPERTTAAVLPPAAAPVPASAARDDASVASIDASIADSAPSLPPEPPPLPWPEATRSVLHVGDSSLGFEQGLALELGTRFKAVGIRYEAVTESTAGLHSFAISKKLEELIRWKKPDLVLLTLGMNNLTSARPDDYAVDVRSIVAQVGDRPCRWIGPLSINRPEKGLIAMLARSTAPCGWTNSYALEIERQPDQIHPTQPGASHWADAIWMRLGAPLVKEKEPAP
jgi:lysophospholipase L1-like esterase